MKKIIFNVLLLGSSIAFGMEQSDTGWLSWLWKKKKINFVPEKIAQLRKEKTAFETELSVCGKAGSDYGYTIKLPRYFQGFAMIKNPKIFLERLYDWKYTQSGSFLLEMLEERLNKDTDPFKSYLSMVSEEEVNSVFNYTFVGCGAIGAAVIARNLEVEKKEALIARLLSLGFLPTKKDLNLAYLDLWERTQEDSTSKALLCFGSKDKNSILSCLPFDLIKLIAQFIMEEEPRLPREFFENGIIKIQSIEGIT